MESEFLPSGQQSMNKYVPPPVHNVFEADLPLVKAGVSVIIIKDGRVLVGIRSGSHGAGVYAFPGGHLEYDDDSLAACCEREALEETGIVCKVISPDGYRDELFTTFDILAPNKRYTTIYLIAEYVSGGTWNGNNEIVPLEPHKCKSWHWVTLDELGMLMWSKEQKIWIPFDKIEFYLKGHYGL